MTAEEFKSTILANYRRMYAAALAMLANSDDASDAVQDTVARLWERRESLGDVDSPASFCIFLHQGYKKRLYRQNPQPRGSECAD